MWDIRQRDGRDSSHFSHSRHFNPLRRSLLFLASPACFTEEPDAAPLRPALRMDFAFDRGLSENAIVLRYKEITD